jgi:hypothetical protein
MPNHQKLKKFITVDSNKQVLLKILGELIVKYHEGSQPNRFAPNESIYVAGAGNIKNINKTSNAWETTQLRLGKVRCQITKSF